MQQALAIKLSDIRERALVAQMMAQTSLLSIGNQPQSNNRSAESSTTQKQTNRNYNREYTVLASKLQ